MWYSAAIGNKAFGGLSFFLGQIVNDRGRTDLMTSRTVPKAVRQCREGGSRMRSSVPSPRQPWDTLVRISLLLLVMVAASCSATDDLFPVDFKQPETTVAYEVALVGSPSDEITALVEQSLSTYRFSDNGAVSLAFLRRRVEADVPTLLKILRSRGYYSSNAEAKVEETAPGNALVTITAAPGQPYMLTRHDFTIEPSGTIAPPTLDAAALSSPVGGQALSAEIAAAEGAGVAALRKAGFPYAEFKGRSGMADPAAATLEVDSTIAAGPAYTFGAVTFEGLQTVDEAYLLSYLPWEVGETFDTEALDEFQRLLFATELFAAAVVRPPDAPLTGAVEPAPLPVTVVLEEGPRRRITGGLRYDTDLGPTVRATFAHRNLFGANERLRAELDVGTDEQSFGLGLRKPQYLRPGQDLLLSSSLGRTDKPAYDALTTNVFIGLERKLTERWRVRLGALGEISDIDDNGDDGTAKLLGAPLFATYDGSNDLLNPTEGARLQLEATPFFGVFDHSDTEFLVLNATGSIYWPLDRGRRFVIAGRGRVASILATDLGSIPATRRLYSGGGGSVRGYEADFIGPLDNDDDPVGGRSALEAGMELRAQLFGDVGGVVFVDAGSVSTEMFPDFAEGIQAAAGIGLRYHSPAGPIRIDFAVPVNRRSSDDAFQFYFSIGQAF
jgi:translocation and assembly module TamA